eukprot:jgi/Ulvmu1/4497/UM002_0223.1
MMPFFISSCPTGWRIWALCVLVSLFNIGNAQNCKTVSPCTDPDSVARFASYSNATLFTAATDECGPSLEAFSEAMVGPCFDELVVRPGCDCGTRACRAAVQPLVSQTCKRAILSVVCDAADWLEPQLAANVRSMYLHVLNDCALGSLEGCSADNFDDSVCAGLPASAPAAIAPGPTPSPALAPTVALGPRCNENLTLIFVSGPGPAPAGLLDEPPQVVPDVVQEPALVTAMADPPALVDPIPTAAEPVATAEEPEPAVDAEAPLQEARDGASDTQDDQVSDPEADAAMHPSPAVVCIACAVLAGLLWG